MNIDTMKEKFLKGELEQGIFSSKDNEGNEVVVGVGKDGFQLSTYQSNGWVRVNIYTYDKENNEWINEETYEK